MKPTTRALTHAAHAGLLLGLGVGCRSQGPQPADHPTGADAHPVDVALAPAPTSNAIALTPLDRAEPLPSATAAPKACCKGHNECKGQGQCKTDKHECKGRNDCKGTGGCKSSDC